MATGNRVPTPFKILGIWVLHVFRRRLVGIYLDPVLACNLRCRMCYFSDAEQRKRYDGRRFETADIDKVEQAFFHRALKLQIGCGAEPTLYPELRDLIARGRKAGIPYISLTTNGQLIAMGRVNLLELVEAGLDEITLSAHGTRPETYEYLMPGADFSNFEKLIELLAKIKATYPKFKIRLNFTVNSLNVHDLAGNRFWQVWQGVQPDIVQLRPVQRLGETAWTDFDLADLKTMYDETIGHVAAECRRRGIVCVAPEREQIERVTAEQDGFSTVMEDMTYCYISPRGCYRDGFDLETDTYEAYHRRMHSGRRLFRAIFSHAVSRKAIGSKKLNYTVK